MYEILKEFETKLQPDWQWLKDLYHFISNYLLNFK